MQYSNTNIEELNNIEKIPEVFFWDVKYSHGPAKGKELQKKQKDFKQTCLFVSIKDCTTKPIQCKHPRHPPLAI